MFFFRDENPIGNWTLKVWDQDQDDEHGYVIGWTMTLWGSSRDASKAGPFTLKSTDELPIAFPPPEPTPVPDTTAISPSTTKSYLKPTHFTTTAGGNEDIASPSEPAQTAPAAVGEEGMDDETRNLIAFVGSVVAVAILAGAAYIIVRRVKRNREAAGGGDYAPVSREDGEEVRMHLLESAERRPVSAVGRTDVVFDGDEEERRLITKKGELASTEVGFHSGFLSDEDGEDVETHPNGVENTSSPESRRT